MADASDDFNRADGGLGANWTTMASGLTISSNQVVSSGSPAEVFRSAEAFADDQFSQVKVVSGAGNAWLVLHVRVQDALNYYAAYSQAAFNGTVLIFKFVAGSGSVLASGSLSTGTDGDTVKFEAVGTSLRYYQAGGLELSASDSTYTSGSPGFGAYSQYVVDDWAGGPIAGGGGAGKPWYAYAQQRVRTRIERSWHKRGLLWTPSYAFGKAA